MALIRRFHVTSHGSMPEGRGSGKDQRSFPLPLPDTGKRAVQPKIEPSAKPPRNSPLAVWKKSASDSKGT